MNRNSNHFIHQTAKAALITTVALALLLPPDSLAAAESGSGSSAVSTATNAGGSAAVTGTPDLAKVKVTQEEAVARLQELFPILKNASVSNVQLGANRDYYSSSANQMVWSIEWQYLIGTGGYGFSSMVDAITGDLISTHLFFPVSESTAYYPPKVSRAEALEKARSFIAAAAPSLKSEQIQLADNIPDMSNEVLFGPIQYRFSFNMIKNGVPSVSDFLNITINGNGEVVEFSKPSTSQAFPSSKPAVSKEQAQKKFADSFDVALHYTPVYNNGAVASWILGWKAGEKSLYMLDAQTGDKIDNAGQGASASISHEAIPLGKVVFQPLTSGKEITAQEAVQLVQKAVSIPKDRKLIRQMLTNGYQQKDQKVWMLTWGGDIDQMKSGVPSHSFAMINAVTGEILQFQSEQYNDMATGKEQPAADDSKKLTPAEAKQKVMTYINLLYDKANSSLKLVEHGGTWSLKQDGKGYRYEFIRYHQGIPVSDSSVYMELDFYGGLQTYSAGGNLDYTKITEKPVPVISKVEALKSYLSHYDLQLQFFRTEGYYGTQSLTKPVIKLVYAPRSADIAGVSQVLDANTGKWVTLNESYSQTGTVGDAVDLKGHPAEKQLAVVLKYGLLTPDKDGKINPDQEITTGDWLTLIAGASSTYYKGYSGVDSKAVAGVSPESPYYDAVNYAVNRGWIGRDIVLKPENTLSREELAVLLTSFLKYEKISTFLANDAVVTSFSDSAAISNKGAVALAVKLGLLQGENGKFNPQQKVTKALAAAVIMRLVELQGDIDQPTLQY